MGAGDSHRHAAGNGHGQATGCDQSAEVTITNKGTGAARTVNTNDVGEYRVDLQPGIYSVKATAKGFSVAEAKELEVFVGRTLTQNFSLVPGGVSETVEVTAGAPLVDQTKTDVSLNITPEQITDLPLIGRDIADLAYLSPGVRAADSDEILPRIVTRFCQSTAKVAAT